MAVDIIMNLFVLEQMCLVSATNVLLSNSSTPAGCRRASEKAVAHCMYSDVRLCTSMCPLNEDKKSAVKVYKACTQYIQVYTLSGNFILRYTDIY